MQKILSITLLVIFIGTLFFIFKKGPAAEPLTQSPAPAPLAGERCYSRALLATPELPFSVEEYMKLAFDNTAVTGTKFGFQEGPGVSNGYTGTLKGVQDGNAVVLDYSYTVEGSNNIEREIYNLIDGTVERIQYVLKEENKMLVPDMNQEVRRIKYSPISCDVFDEKLPK